MCLSGCSTTAPATTGPARHPRPTSSTPHTRLKPSLRRTFSSVRVAATRVMTLEIVRFVGFVRAVRGVGNLDLYDPNDAHDPYVPHDPYATYPTSRLRACARPCPSDRGGSRASRGGLSPTAPLRLSE